MLFELFFWDVVSIAELVEMTDSAVVGGVVEVVSSIPAMGHKTFSAFFGNYISLTPNIYQFYLYSLNPAGFHRTE